MHGCAPAYLQVGTYLKEHDITGLDLTIQPPVEAVKVPIRMHRMATHAHRPRTTKRAAPAVRGCSLVHLSGHRTVRCHPVSGDHGVRASGQGHYLGDG